MGMHRKSESFGIDPPGQADFHSRISDGEARRSGERLLEIDEYAAYARAPHARPRKPNPAGTPIHLHVGEGPAARPPGRRVGGLRLIALASVAAVALGSCLLAATWQMVMKQSSTAPALAGDPGPIDMTRPGLDPAKSERAGAAMASVREIPLVRAGVDRRAVAEVAVPLPRLRPERDIAEATPAQGSIVQMESKTVRPVVADPDPELVARIEKALAEAPDDPVAASAPDGRSAAGVLAGAETVAPADAPPLPAGVKLPPEDIPYVSVGSV